MAHVVYVNGSYCHALAADLSVYDRGTMLGDACYEVVPILNGVGIDLHPHLDRLDRSLAAIEVALPLTRFALVAILRRLIRRNRLQDGLVYLQVSRGSEIPRNHLPGKGLVPNLFACTVAKRLVAPSVTDAGVTGLRLLSVPDNRWGEVWIKTTNLLPNCLAKMRAAQEGYDDAVLVDASTGIVRECTASNIWFITHAGELVTAPADRQILNGITRQTLIRLAKAHGLAVVEREFALEELYGAKEAFVSSATQFVTPVCELDGRRIGNAEGLGEHSAQLRAHYGAAIRTMVT